jgi:type I restriction enzyme M protein
MLDQDTKRRIDSCRDMLVGKIPDPKSQVEQITIALIYKFMDDMDREAVDMGGKSSFFTGDYTKYSWTAIFDPRIGGHELLKLYGEAIEKMNQNPNIPQLFRDIFKNAYLPYRDPETLKLFLKEISNFEYSHSEKLGDAFEYLLSFMGTQGDAGQFRTPRNIIDFIVAVVNPKKTETILDPACGTAGFMISAYKHILKANDNGNKLTPTERNRLLTSFSGYDISPDMVRLSLVNLYLHGFQDPKIYEYDTLTSEDRWDETVDVVLANPPFMTPKGGIRPHKRFAVQAKRSEVLFVDYIAEHLNPSGRAGVIVPEGIIFQSSNAYKALRKMLVEDYLWAVVSLPAGVFNPYAGVKTSILLMDKTKAKQNDSILFVKVENDGFDLGAQRRPIDKNDLPEALSILQSGDADDTEIAHWVEKSKIEESGDWNLSGEGYKESGELLISNFKKIRLGNVTKVLNGYAFKSKNYVENGIRVVRITNVQKGRIVDENPKFYPFNTKEKIEKYELLEHDLLISLTGNIGRVGRLPSKMLPAALNQRVGCLRPNREKIADGFLFNLLNNKLFRNDCEKSASGIAQQNLSTVWLSDYEIPLPPLSVQEEIVGEIDGYQKIIDGALQVVENYKPTIKIDPDWEMVKLGEVGKIRMCKRIFKNQTSDSGDIPFYKIGTFGKQPDAYISREVYEDYKAKFSHPKKGDILLSTSGTIGRTVVFDGKPAYFQDSNIVWLDNDESLVTNEYLYLIYQTIKWVTTKGGTIERLYNKLIKNTEIPLPPLSVQKKIVTQIEGEQEMVNGNKKLIEIYEQKIKDKIGEVWGE